MYLRSKLEGVVVSLEEAVPPQVLLPPPVDDTGKIILAAADLIRKHGWVRGEYWSARGLCTMGALYWAIKGVMEPVDGDHPAIQRVMRHLGLEYPDHIIMWNDTRCRDQAQAIAMLETAARCVL